MVTTLFDTEDFWDEDPDIAQDEWHYFKKRLISLCGNRYCVMQGYEGAWDGKHKAGFCGDIREAVTTIASNNDDFKFEDRDGQLWIVAAHHDGRNEYHAKSLTNLGEELYYDEEENYVLTKEQLHDKLMSDGFSTEISFNERKVECVNE